MTTFFKKFNEMTNDVVKYNAIQNKVAPFSSDDVANQTSRVNEEIKELKRNIEKLRSGKMTHELAVAIMDDIADIAVTLSFLVSMQGESPLEYHREVRLKNDVEILEHLVSCRPDRLGLGKFIAIVDKLNAYPEIVGCKKFDVLGAFEEVNQNNLSKMVSEDDERLEQIIQSTLAKYPDEEIEMVRRDGLIAFQRKSDNKNMKPSTYIDVDLNSFVEVLQ